MTLQEVINMARYRLDDTTLPYLWSDDELIEYINFRINELCEKCGVIKDAETPSICEIAVTANEPFVSTDTRVIKVLTMKLDSTGYDMAVTSREVMAKYYYGGTDVSWEEETGTPRKYIIDGQNRFRLYPIPEENDTLICTVTRYPMSQLTSSMLNSELEIHWKYHQKLINGIIALAYTKNDAETSLDPKKIAYYEQLWQRDLGDIHQWEINSYYRDNVLAPLYGCI